jgi:hypothetical protein
VRQVEELSCAACERSSVVQVRETSNGIPRNDVRLVVPDHGGRAPRHVVKNVEPAKGVESIKTFCGGGGARALLQVNHENMWRGPLESADIYSYAEAEDSLIMHSRRVFDASVVRAKTD